MATLVLEHHQLEQNYAELRSTSKTKECRLLASLAQLGQQSPVVVIQAQQENRYVLIDGYKRVRALDKLRQDTVIAVDWQLKGGSSWINYATGRDQIASGCRAEPQTALAVVTSDE